MCIPLPFCSPPVCPKDDCGEELTAEDGVKYFPDRFVRREILSLPIVCSRRDRGCNWEGKFSELEVGNIGQKLWF